MSIYKVDFGKYSLIHSTRNTYFNYFKYDTKKYSIGAFVKLTDKGHYELYRNAGYSFIRGNVQLVDYYIDSNGREYWEYILGWHNDASNRPVLHTTQLCPDIIVSQVLCTPIDESVTSVGELEIEFKEPNYSPSDWEVEGLISGWFVLLLVLLSAFFLKDWWIRILIWISAGFYFDRWRDKKISNAISTQKFRKRK